MTPHGDRPVLKVANKGEELKLFGHSTWLTPTTQVKGARFTGSSVVVSAPSRNGDAFEVHLTPTIEGPLDGELHLDAEGGGTTSVRIDLFVTSPSLANDEAHAVPADNLSQGLDRLVRASDSLFQHRIAGAQKLVVATADKDEQEDSTLAIRLLQLAASTALAAATAGIGTIVSEAVTTLINSESALVTESLKIVSERALEAVSEKMIEDRVRSAEANGKHDTQGVTVSEINAFSEAQNLALVQEGMLRGNALRTEAERNVKVAEANDPGSGYLLLTALQNGIDIAAKRANDIQFRNSLNAWMVFQAQSSTGTLRNSGPAAPGHPVARGTDLGDAVNIGKTMLQDWPAVSEPPAKGVMRLTLQKTGINEIPFVVTEAVASGITSKALAGNLPKTVGDLLMPVIATHHGDSQMTEMFIAGRNENNVFFEDTMNSLLRTSMRSQTNAEATPKLFESIKHQSIAPKPGR